MKRAAMILCCALGTWAQEPSAESLVECHGRPVQVDGFLMEWREDAARPFPGRESIAVDACNTPAGLAGYVRWPAADSCSPVNVALLPRDSGSPTVMTVSDSGVSGGGAVVEDNGWRVLEFVVPWDRAGHDSSGTYRVVLIVEDACGNANSLRLAGNTRAPLRRIVTPRLMVQASVSVILLILYVVFYTRIRRRRSSESLRR